MQITTILAAALHGLGVSAQLAGPNGKRFCAGGAISCQYQKGRCANICVDSVKSGGSNAQAVIDAACSCPYGTKANRYTGAACIDVFRALGRHGCTDHGP
ncbi:hypothetical protein IFR05_001992 [Cadophora sp. M221]|nr:hypothetical protein IFR05_001992 [Cadophora sp. M221]